MRLLEFTSSLCFTAGGALLGMGVFLGLRQGMPWGVYPDVVCLGFIATGAVVGLIYARLMRR